MTKEGGGAATAIENKLGQPFKPKGALCDIKLEDILEKAGFDTEVHRPLTTAESMVFLALSLDEKAKLTHDRLGKALTCAAERYLGQLDKDLGRAAKSGDPSAAGRAARLQRLVAQMLNRIRGGAGANGAFPHFLAAYPDTAAEAIQRGIANFFFNWNECTKSPARDAGTGETNTGENKTGETKNGDPDEPDYAIQLSQSAAGADAMLKEAMNGFSMDVQSLTTEPLMAWIRSEVQQGDARASGIDIVGRTSIVATSRQSAKLEGKTQSFFPFMPQNKLTLDDLSAKPDADAIDGTSLKGISPLEYQLLTAALREPKRVYDTVAPGVALEVRPQVLRDGGSARLTFDLTVSTNVTQGIGADGKAATDPLDRIESHHFTSDFSTQALDLLEVSTFGMDTTAPGDPSWRIPILEQIPILGDLFRGPRTRLTKHQESLMIVNVTILPKSLDLAGRFIHPGL